MKRLILVISLLTITLISFSQDESTELIRDNYDVEKFVHDELLIRNDSFVLRNMNYKSDSLIDYFVKLTKNDLSELTDAIIERRLKEIPTNLNIRFTPEIGNLVRNYLYNNRLYIVKMLTRSEYYFPLFEIELDKRNMPLELKYLAVIESSLNPRAKSSQGATGLWQFMYATAVFKGISITSLEDERRDPLASTRYAADYLKQLHGIYGDWLLALSAYNAGSGNINKAVKAAGGVKNYWVVRKHLPSETQLYVPKIIALMYAMHYAEDYLLYPSKPNYHFLDVERVRVFDMLTLKYSSELLQINEDDLSALNPILSKSIIPKCDTGYCIIIPRESLHLFDENKDLFFNDPYLAVKDKALEDKHIESFKYANSSSGNYKTYTVVSGDNLGFIAKKFGCSVTDIKNWNGLSSSSLSIGKKLKIYSNKSAAPVAKAPEVLAVSNANIGFKATEIDTKSCQCDKHEIVSGDNLWSISMKYKTDLERIKQVNNIPKGWVLKLGTYLKIPKI